MNYDYKVLVKNILAGCIVLATAKQPPNIAIGGAMAGAGLFLYKPRQEQVGELLESYPRVAQELPQSYPNVTPKLLLENHEPLFRLVTDAINHPHILVIGKTGSGKTTLAQGLAALGNGKRYAIAPHLDPGKKDSEWLGCHGVFCGGRNYGSPEDEDVAYDDIINNRVPNATAFQILRSLYAEMDRRYRDPAGFESHEYHDWFLDETPAIARALDKQFAELVAPQAYEARKVKLRLWVLTQNDNVRALKLEGQGKVRDNFTYLYLGKQAHGRVQSLVNDKVLDAKYLAEVKGERIAVVDETPCLVPTKSELDQLISANLPASRFVQFRCGEQDLPRLSKLPKTDEEVAASLPVLVNLLDYGLAEGLSKTNIIKELWGYKGKNYPIGVKIMGTIGYSPEDEVSTTE